MENGKLVAEAGFCIGFGKGMGKLGEPLAEECLNFLFVKPIGYALRKQRIGTAQEPVIERLKINAAQGELAFVCSWKISNRTSG